MRMLFPLVAILSAISGMPCSAQIDTIRLMKSLLPVANHVEKLHMSRPNKCIFLSMTSAEEMKANAGVGEVSYITKICEFTKKKWMGLQRGPHTDLFLVNKEELKTLFSIVRRTSESFPISSKEDKSAAQRDVMKKGSFHVILLDDRVVDDYNLDNQKIALDYETKLINLVKESSINSAKKAEIVKLFRTCFGGLTR